MVQMTPVLSPSKDAPEYETTAFVTEVASVSSSTDTPILVDPVSDAYLVTTVTGIVSAMAICDWGPAIIEGVRTSLVDPSASTTVTGLSRIHVS